MKIAVPDAIIPSIEPARISHAKIPLRVHAEDTAKKARNFRRLISLPLLVGLFDIDIGFCLEALQLWRARTDVELVFCCPAPHVQQFPLKD
jgi:hypothetical protein